MMSRGVSDKWEFSRPVAIQGCIKLARERGCVVLDQPQRCGTVLRLVEDDTAAPHQFIQARLANRPEGPAIVGKMQ